MVKRVFELLHKEINSLHEAAYLLGFFAFLSQILALVRDRLLAGSFGAGETLDIYYAAFRVPDIIFVSAASLVSSSILVPFIVSKAANGNEECRKFVNGIFSSFFIFILLVSLAAFFLAPYILSFLFRGFEAEALEKLVLLTRIMLLQPIFLGISNFFGSITQTYKKFLVYSLSPVLYNGGIILGVVFLYPRFGLTGLAWGVVIGAFLHFLIQVPVVMRQKLFPNFTLKVRWKEIKEVVFLSLPRTLALSAANFSTLFLVALGSLLGTGSVSIFTLAWNLQSVPLSIVGASYSMAAFPTLVAVFVNGGKDKFLTEVSSALRHILFWSAPALILFIVLRAQIVRVVLGFGEFSWSDTRLTAASLALFALSVVAQGVIVLLIRAYYAGGRTARPLLINVLSSVAAVILGFVLVKIFSSIPIFRYFVESLLKVSGLSGTAVLMLPLAYSSATILNALFLFFIFRKDFGVSLGLRRAFWQTFAASIIGGFATYLFLNVLDDVFNLNKVFGVFSQGFFSGIGGLAVNILVLYSLKSVELRETWRTLHGKIWKARLVVTDPTEPTAI